MLKPKAMIILTFGKNRTSRDAARLDQRLRAIHANHIQLFIEHCIKTNNHPQETKAMETIPYKSLGGSNGYLTYETTVVKW
jgi:hypothetical protein